MFSFTYFNQDISSWNVSSVTNMNSMFSDAYNFNQNLSSWNVSNVTNMSYMFNGAGTFNQNLSSWVVNPNVTTCIRFAPGSWSQPKPNFTSCNPN